MLIWYEAGWLYTIDLADHQAPYRWQSPHGEIFLMTIDLEKAFLTIDQIRNEDIDYFDIIDQWPNGHAA